MSFFFFFNTSLHITQLNKNGTALNQKNKIKKKIFANFFYYFFILLFVRARIDCHRLAANLLDFGLAGLNQLLHLDQLPAPALEFFFQLILLYQQELANIGGRQGFREIRKQRLELSNWLNFIADGSKLGVLGGAGGSSSIRGSRSWLLATVEQIINAV